MILRQLAAALVVGVLSKQRGFAQCGNGAR